MDAISDRPLMTDAADVVVLKPMALGGIDPRVTRLDGRAAGIETVVTTTLDVTVARAGTVHLAAGLAPVPPTALATGDLLADDLVADPIPVEDGAIAVRRETDLASTCRGTSDG